MNIALLAKWWWRFFAERNHQWGAPLNAIYYHRRKPLLEGRSFKPFSFWWWSVLTTREIFKCGISFSIRDGKKVDFWNDIWCDHLSLRISHWEIFDKVTSRNLRVHECWNGNGWRWHKIMAGFSFTSQTDNTLAQQFMDSVNALALTNCLDDVRWRWTPSEIFLVRSLYLFVQDGGVAVKRYDRMWKMRSPLKVKIFVWLVLKNKVLTADNLLKRG